MSTKQAEMEARRYLTATGADASSPADYDRALRKATASFDQLQKAVRLAEKIAAIE
jgi:hypothetical protein